MSTTIQKVAILATLLFLNIETVRPDPPRNPDFIAFVKEFSYPAEEHFVTTDDGYRLRLHRIPGNSSDPDPSGKPVVYCSHGLFGSSDLFILQGPTMDLAYQLADAGYDVWFGNARGNVYSRSHVQLSPDDDDDYWDFSWHEIGQYDTPASVDYILNTTEQKSLIFLGHSMGTIVSYAFLTSRPEYNDKMDLVISYAPTTYWRPAKFIAWVLMYASPILRPIINFLGIHEFFPLSSLLATVLGFACKDGNPLQYLCLAAIYPVAGYDPSELNTAILPKLFSVYPAGTSTRTVFHYTQNIDQARNADDTFNLYDYGDDENLIRYNQTNPPPYDLSKIVAPVAVFYSEADGFVSADAIRRFATRLPNLRTVEQVPKDAFSHIDFLYGKDVKTLLNDRVMKILSDLPKTKKNVTKQLVKNNTNHIY